jgi:diaminopimelate decarboxylase
MHHFTYRNNELFCENVSIREIADAVGTPFYLYSHATLTRHFNAFDSAFDQVKRLICYSAKANTGQAILKLFESLGSGLDIVSGGELYRGLKAGFVPEKIVYSGVGKRVDEIDDALMLGILMFNVESFEELQVINERAGALKKKAPISLRVNPNVDPKTHPYISTGLKKNKFGIESETAIEAYKLAKKLKNLDIKGIDCHIGSQITEVEPFKDALTNLLGLVEELNHLQIDIRYLDMGGGLGITYDQEAPPLPVDYAKSITSQLKDKPYTLILEPGRVLVGNAGILVSKVLYRKTGELKTFTIVDAGMNDLMRPTLYQAYHGVMPIIKTTRPLITSDIVGPICESGDFLAQDRDMDDFKRGDLMALMSAGAYGFAMASNYCSRPRAAEVMVKDNDFFVVRARETYSDLVKGETIPDFLMSA